MKNPLEIKTLIQRVIEMEHCFDILKEAWQDNPSSFQDDDSVREMLHKLTYYYDSGQWLSDYEQDERGMLPSELKRGILSEDALYNFLCDIGAGFENESC